MIEAALAGSRGKMAGAKAPLSTSAFRLRPRFENQAVENRESQIQDSILTATVTSTFNHRDSPHSPLYQSLTSLHRRRGTAVPCPGVPFAKVG